MGGFFEPSPSAREPDNSRRIILVAIAGVVALALIAAFLLRQAPKPADEVPPYAAKLKLSDLKMSQAENFVGASVTYIDGTLTNTGDQTLTHAGVRVTFRDAYNQVAQVEDIPLRVLKTSGPYPDTVDLAASPLAPGQNTPFRLILEHVSEQWNQAYPELRIVNLAAR